MARPTRRTPVREKQFLAALGRGDGPIETAVANLTDTERAQEVLRVLRRGGETRD